MVPGCTHAEAQEEQLLDRGGGLFELSPGRIRELKVG